MDEEGEYQRAYSDYFLNTVLQETKIREGLGLTLNELYDFYTDIEVMKLGVIAGEVIRLKNKAMGGKSDPHSGAAALRYSKR